jgi:hypothetical protein
MIKHRIVKYGEDGEQYIASWIELHIFGKIICISERRINLVDEPELKLIKV